MKTCVNNLILLEPARYPSPALGAPTPLGHLFGVSSAFEAAVGGLPGELRKNTGPKVPSGTTENSPRFQPWVAGGNSLEPRKGERKAGHNGGTFRIRPILVEYEKRLRAARCGVVFCQNLSPLPGSSQAN